MSIVTVQRSPTPSDAGNYEQWDVDQLECRSPTPSEQTDSSACYFYVKGTAVVLLQPDRTNTSHPSADGEIEEHLQAMLRMLSPQHTMIMAVRLQAGTESNKWIDHVRYLAVVVCTHDCESEMRDVVLLGIDCLSNTKATIGVVIPVYASMRVTLDGDGGVVVDVDSSLYIFRPVSVQAMWTLFQCLQKELVDAQNSKSPLQQFAKFSKRLIDFYKYHVSSDDTLRAQWERSTLDCCYETSGDLAATSADAERFCREICSDHNSVESRIYKSLKEVMQTVDLDEVTSMDIRKKVEESMHMDLRDYKDFISRQMMVIMGQMDKASQIFSYLYLGTEWNACDWQWLEANRQKGYAVLVHCKKGISRSSSTVIAFAMKEYDWDLSKAMEYVKDKRDCITPNKGFVEQLKTFEGILDASKKRIQFDSLPSTSSEGDVVRPVSHRRLRSCMNGITSVIAEEVVDCDKSDENVTSVKNLVGSFEAKGRSNDSSRLVTRPDRSLVSLRMRNVTEWKLRDRMSVPATNSCSTSTLRQGRALTISQ